MTSLTHKQNQLLAFLKSRLAESQVAPSYEEMAAHLGLKSKQGIHRLILGLEERGAIRRIPGKARAVEIAEGETAAVSSFRKRLLESLDRYPETGTFTIGAIRTWLRDAA